MAKASVDIIIPVHNAADTLERCLDSVAAQTFDGWRALLINDRSTDESPEILRRYAEKDSRFVPMESDRDPGASGTRNCGLTKIAADWVTFLDADDWWEPKMLETLLNTAESTDSDVVQCDYIIEYPGGTQAAETPMFEDVRVFEKEEFDTILEKMLAGISMNSIWKKIVRADLVRGLEFDTRLRTAEDLLFNFNLLLRTSRWTFIPDRLYHYYRSGATLTGSSLSFKAKWQCNRIVSTEISKRLKGTSLDSPKHRLQSFLRPYRITIPKLLRMVRDRKNS